MLWFNVFMVFVCFILLYFTYLFIILLIYFTYLFILFTEVVLCMCVPVYRNHVSCCIQLSYMHFLLSRTHHSLGALLMARHFVDTAIYQVGSCYC